MKNILLFLLLLPLGSMAQMQTIYDMPFIKNAKVNLFLEKGTKNIFSIQQIDSIGKSGISVQIHTMKKSNDTATYTVAFPKPFKQVESALYKSLVGQQFPEFKFTDIQGKVVQLKDLKNKIVLLNFWYTSCGPCINEMPVLNGLVDSHNGKDIVFLGFALDNKEKLNTFLKKRQFKYTIIPASEEFATSIGIVSYPTNIILDSDGKVIQVIEGINVEKDTNRPLIDREIMKTLSILMK